MPATTPPAAPLPRATHAARAPSTVLRHLGYWSMPVLLPALVIYLVTAVRHFEGHLVVPDARFWAHVEGPSLRAALLYVAWFALQSAFATLLPGRRVKGETLADGQRLAYRLNGLAAHLLTLASAAGLTLAGALPATLLYDELGALVTTINLLVGALCFYVQWLGQRQATEPERARPAIERFVVGATLNPRSRGFDWKFFCESRPGMVLWILVDLSLAAAQLRAHGEVSTSMLLVCAFQLLYVTDYFVFEEAILTTWDIRHEPFGFMLCWGSLVWVPFTFSLQALYLVQHPTALSPLSSAGLCALNLSGYAIFRGSNLQKHRFRRDPNTRIWGLPARYIETRRGTRLLTSGYWGLARHSNYLGDLMMGLSWCLTTGFAAPLPYFYFVYFVILLVHRERRDQAHCARKYGEDWKAYEAQVPWRILPYVY